MQKVVINVCYGGYSLSEKAWLRLRALNHPAALAELKSEYMSYCRDIPRDDTTLVQVVEELGSVEASGPYAKLRIVEVPDGVRWQIEEYDGKEWIAEQHQTWS